MLLRHHQSTTPTTTSSNLSPSPSHEFPDYFRFNSNNDSISSRSPLPLSALTRRAPQEGSVHRPAFPASTHPLNISSASSNSRSRRSSASPSPLSPAPRSPYRSSSRHNSPQPSAAGLPRPAASRMASYTTPYTRSSTSSSSSGIQDVLATGDIIGEGSLLEGERLQVVTSSVTERKSLASTPDPEEPAKEFEVVRRLGAGSYAVVYLVKEVLYRPPPVRSDDGFEVMDEDLRRPSTIYGREYAIKCLSKADLDEEALEAQMAEATIHLSLRAHPNVVTLHRTLETHAFLLLLLEYVPGEDLFYFLEQARDHYEPSNAPLSPGATELSRTPPTPGLLSTLNPSQLLGRTRLRLIAAMFGQMCDAVAHCHKQSVFHRDIKPENFIVTDGWTDVVGADGVSVKAERKVVVKLTDFGLSTTDEESGDMDCGSAPYMSYECRNNVAPTYQPGPADVWSLGIVLINMLYHFNPWSDTAEGACKSFSTFRTNPVHFLMMRFAGMTLPVAEFLATRVFNTLDGPEATRASAREFGIWVKDLPDLLSAAPSPIKGHKRVVSTSSTTGFALTTSTPVSRRPCSRQASGISAAVRTPIIAVRSLSRTSSYGAMGMTEVSELSTVIDQADMEELLEAEQEDQNQDDDDDDYSSVVQTNSRSTSTNKRRKRGARKGKSVATSSTLSSPAPVSPIALPSTPKDQTLFTLAVASESLAREISVASKVSRKSATSSVSTKQSTESARARRRQQPYEPVSLFPLPTSMMTGSKDPVSVASKASPSTVSLATSNPSMHSSSSASKSATSSSAAAPKKKWFSLGKSSGAAVLAPVERVSPVEEMPSSSSSNRSTTSSHSRRAHSTLSPTASNVTDILQSLAPPAPPVPAVPRNHSHGRGELSLNDARDGAEVNRGRRMRTSPNSSYERLPAKSPASQQFSRSPHPATRNTERAVSPNSIASKTTTSHVSSNWRSSMMSTSTASTSGFTKYSNNSARSVSTANTSVSGQSWRTTGSKPTAPSVASASSHNHHGNNLNMPPRNVKIMDGIPWGLNELPRQQHPNPSGDINFGAPLPPRKQRTRKPGATVGKEVPHNNLDTISERPAFKRSPLSMDVSNNDPMASTMSLGGDDRDGPKKVQKGQINTLAKMLSALRR